MEGYKKQRRKEFPDYLPRKGGKGKKKGGKGGLSPLERRREKGARPFAVALGERKEKKSVFFRRYEGDGVERGKRGERLIAFGTKKRL